jgi:2'-5' RNA ligase
MFTFLALAPDARLHDLIQSYKDRARAIVGEQLYLADPPHLTLFLAAFPPGFAPLDPLELGPAPRVRLVGWHQYLADPLTGNNTLVARIHDDDLQALRLLQAHVLSAVAPHRDTAATTARYAGRLSALTPAQREAIHTYGFPFVHDGWQPHFTVASFTPAVWPAVLAEFATDTPEGSYSCSAIRHYQLDGIRPIFRTERHFTSGE